LIRRCSAITQKLPNNCFDSVHRAILAFCFTLSIHSLSNLAAYCGSLESFRNRTLLGPCIVGLHDAIQPFGSRVVEEVLGTISWNGPEI